MKSVAKNMFSCPGHWPYLLLSTLCEIFRCISDARGNSFDEPALGYKVAKIDCGIVFETKSVA